jgi:hypothetical protein
MTVQVNPEMAAYERILVKVIRALPANRAAQLVDFARFLEAQTLADHLAQEENAEFEEILADNAKWDALFATEQSQQLLEKMADEALAEHRAGRTRPMKFTDDGRIVPG